MAEPERPRMRRHAAITVAKLQDDTARRVTGEIQSLARSPRRMAVLHSATWRAVIPTLKSGSSVPAARTLLREALRQPRHMVSYWHSRRL